MKKIVATIAAVLMLAGLSACTHHQKEEVNEAYRQTDKDVREIGGEARDDLNKAYEDTGAPIKGQ